jgi:hypothetical protein
MIKPDQKLFARGALWHGAKNGNTKKNAVCAALLRLTLWFPAHKARGHGPSLPIKQMPV